MLDALCNDYSCSGILPGYLTYPQRMALFRRLTVRQAEQFVGESCVWELVLIFILTIAGRLHVWPDSWEHLDSVYDEQYTEIVSVRVFVLRDTVSAKKIRIWKQTDTTEKSWSSDSWEWRRCFNWVEFETAVIWWRWSAYVKVLGDW